jgi:Flp pilus assembly protein TadD
VPERLRWFQAAVSVAPTNPAAYVGLGIALLDGEDIAGALAAFRMAVQLDSTLAPARTCLGNALRRTDPAGAAAEFREAARLDPSSAYPRWGLGRLRLDVGDLDGAEVEFREAIRLEPTLALAHSGLGTIGMDRGDLTGAVAAYQTAARLDPTLAGLRINLGILLTDLRQPDRAVAVLTEAVRLEPQSAAAHATLGLALRETGRLNEAVNELTVARSLDPASSRIQRDLELTQYWAANERVLPAVKTGARKPASWDETLVFAHLAAKSFNKEYALAVRLFTQWSGTNPGQASPFWTEAARAAVRLAAGEDASANIGPDEWAYAQSRALVWLTAALADARQRASSGMPTDRNRALAIVARWKHYPDLAAVRDPARLAAMPDIDRVRWQQFWADVDALLAPAPPKS